MFTHKQVHDFCLISYRKNPDFFCEIKGDEKIFVPAYMAAHYIFQHALEGTDEHLLYNVTDEVNKWVVRGLLQRQSMGFVVPLESKEELKFHYVSIKPVGVFDINKEFGIKNKPMTESEYLSTDTKISKIYNGKLLP